jgi:hypothetical protein
MAKGEAKMDLTDIEVVNRIEVRQVTNQSEDAKSALGFNNVPGLQKARKEMDAVTNQWGRYP